jgi:hypothetical protein
MANKNELIDLLMRLHEYMEERAEGDSNDDGGYDENEEMSFAREINDVLYSLGQKGFGDEVRSSIDPNYRFGDFNMNESRNKKVVKLTESQLKEVINRIVNKK